MEFKRIAILLLTADIDVSSFTGYGSPLLYPGKKQDSFPKHKVYPLHHILFLMGLPLVVVPQFGIFDKFLVSYKQSLLMVAVIY